ncbi:MAG: dockerin type I domain-containing protein [Planctomycetales bacterium]|nr:dockerin type I domain-containing protein [Planctomycetales bacterium]
MTPDREPILPEPESLPRLVEALRGLERPPSVPPAMDEAILAAARRRLGRRRARLVRLAPWAAAAGILVAAGGALLSPGTAHAADVNRDGVVDIRDALALARRIEAGGAARPDLTGDGLVDRRDVEAVALVALALVQGPREAGPEAGRARFQTVRLYVDSGDVPLAAWQVEFTAEGGDAKLVGIEGGTHPAYADPPLYDPAALQGGRVVLGAFSTAKDLPAGRTRVATLHLRLSGEARPDCTATLVTAADPEGRRIEAKASIVEGG